MTETNSVSASACMTCSAFIAVRFQTQTMLMHGYEANTACRPCADFSQILLADTKEFQMVQLYLWCNYMHCYYKRFEHWQHWRVKLLSSMLRLSSSALHVWGHGEPYEQTQCACLEDAVCFLSEAVGLQDCLQDTVTLTSNEVLRMQFWQWTQNCRSAYAGRQLSQSKDAIWWQRSMLTNDMHICQSTGHLIVGVFCSYIPSSHHRSLQRLQQFQSTLRSAQSDYMPTTELGPLDVQHTALVQKFQC